jgi:hypothetical protein
MTTLTPERMDALAERIHYQICNDGKLLISGIVQSEFREIFSIARRKVKGDADRQSTWLQWLKTWARKPKTK